MQPYPKIINNTTESIGDAVRQISRLREEDITYFNTIPATYVMGRSVGKVPSGSADVAVTDRIGDLNITKDYIYSCCDDGAGGAVWRRVAQVAW